MLEAEILDLTLAALIPLQDVGFFWRNNTGALELGDRFIRFGIKGAPDIMGVYGGLAIGIECKRPGIKTISVDQRIWSARWTKCGGLYFLVNDRTSIADMVTSLRCALVAKDI